MPTSTYLVGATEGATVGTLVGATEGLTEGTRVGRPVMSAGRRNECVRPRVRHMTEGRPVAGGQGGGRMSVAVSAISCLPSTQVHGRESHTHQSTML